MKIRSAEIGRAVETELAARKQRCKALQQRRRDEVYTKIPAVREIDECITAIAFDMGRQIMDNTNPDEVLGMARELIKSKTQERTELLTSNGFPADYLDEQYFCPVCHDTGRADNELCRCVSQIAVNAAFENSGLNPAQNFKNFDLSLQHDPKERLAVARIRDAALEYANTFPNTEKRDLLYLGEPGVGKTYLLNCIGGRLLERGFSVLKINAYHLIRLTLDTLRTEPDEKPDFLIPDLLIIDDLGTEPQIPNITVETLLSILCQRQDKNKATAFATNLAIFPSEDNNTETLQSMYGERFTSRMLSSRTTKIQLINTSDLRFA